MSSVCLFVCPFLDVYCLSICLSATLPVYMSLPVCVCFLLMLAALCLHSLCPSLYSSVSLSLPLTLGQISLEEFMEGAQKDEWVMEMLKLDFNASGWVNQNWMKTS